MTAIIDATTYARIAAASGETKHCNACNEDHSIEAFAFKNKSAGKLHSRCRSAQKHHSKANYQANGDAVRERARVRRRQVRDAANELVDGWLDGRCSATCGSTDRLTAVTAEHGSLKGLTKFGYNADGIEHLLGRAIVRCRTCGARSER